MRQRGFNFRSFVSFLLTWTFLALVFSGIILYVAPPGRVAHWAVWTMLGLTKEQWQAAHVLIALAFLTGGLFHLFKFNWKTFVHYLRRKRSGTHHGAEAVVSLLLFGIVAAGAVAGLPPFSSVTSLSETLQNAWETKVGAPPMLHLEMLSLREFGLKLQMSPGQAAEFLRQKGLAVQGTDATIKEIAGANGVSPRKIYEEFRQSGYRLISQSPDTPAGPVGTVGP